MTTLYIWAAFSVVFSVFIYFSILRSQNRELKGSRIDFTIIAVTSLIIRIIFSLNSPGYEVDIGCFRAWSDMMATSGPAGFYVDDVFCDYPPGYLYILGIIGIIRPFLHGIELLILKLPAILCDIAMGYFIYCVAGRLIKNKSICAAVAGLYLFSPAVIINSAVWGQVDAVFALPLAISLYFLAEERYKRSAVLYAVSLIIKPQALLFSPIYALAFSDKLINHKDQKNWWLELAKSVGLVLGVSILGVLPFVIEKPPLFIINLYKDTLASYPYATLNSFNLFALAGGNFKPISDRFMFSTYSVWSMVGIVISVFVSGFMFVRGKGKSRYFYCSAALMSMVFMLAGKMHERYLFPVIALYLLAYLFENDKRILATAGVISILHYLNVGYTYVNSRKGIAHIPVDDVFLMVVSILGILSTIYAVYLGFSMYGGIKIKRSAPGELDYKIRRADIIIMAVVTLAYSVLAFSNLGDTKAPKTHFDFKVSPGAVADMGDIKQLEGLIYYKGLGTGEIEIISSRDGVNWEQAARFDAGACFRWERQEVSTSARFLGISPATRDIEIFEIAFFEKDSDAPIKMKYGDMELFDEQYLVPKNISYLNGTYFDEIYHARTAYEHIKGVWPYEITHPPLGKIIIAAGIKIFGMNPFGWRAAGTFLGALMLPLMYIFGKKMFKNTFVATAIMLLMAFDFMHFTQTRIATIDTYGVFFIILMYYFMYLYYDFAKREMTYKRSLLPLLLSGISFGLGMASKWIGAYAGAGLAVLFALSLWRRRANRNEIIKTCLWCILFFVIIPAAIYFASYIPYFKAEPGKSIFTVFWENQKYMLDYHSNLEATHPFSSKFYQWPVMSRPIWYYGGVDSMSPGKVSSIVALGNPAVWWGGILAVLVTGTALILKRDKKAAFIIIALLSQYMPWFFIGRTVFIYHFFASIPFVLLAFGFVFRKLLDRVFYAKQYICTFLALALCLFILFYPIMSGMVVDKSYVTDNLRWFESWVLSY